MHDEARHVSYGLSPTTDGRRVEDFAVASLEAMAGRRRQGSGMSSQMVPLGDMGIDVEEAVREMREKLSDPEFRARQPNVFRDQVLPQLQRIDLITEWTASKYRELDFEV